MAGKAKKTAVTEEVIVEQEVIKSVKQPIVEKQEDAWELKDRFYYLLNNVSPLTYRIRCKGRYYFDPEANYERELLYTRNQKTVFVDEMVGNKQLANVTFFNGVLMVPKNLQPLQKLLSLYHPEKGNTYAERDDEAIAEYETDSIELELEAMNAAVELDIDMAEAIMRAEIGSKVSTMSSKELKRDLLVFAKRNPNLFLDLLGDDNIHLRNIGIKATEFGIIKLSDNNRTFTWGSNNRKLMTVPFDEHPYSALASWFKTDEGMEVLNSIEKRLN
jgi:hypothetical protein